MIIIQTCVVHDVTTHIHSGASPPASLQPMCTDQRQPRVSHAICEVETLSFILGQLT